MRITLAISEGKKKDSTQHEPAPLLSCSVCGDEFRAAAAVPRCTLREAAPPGNAESGQAARPVHYRSSGSPRFLCFLCKRGRLVTVGASCDAGGAAATGAAPSL